MSFKKLKIMSLISILTLTLISTSCASVIEGDDINFVKDDKVRVTLVDSDLLVSEERSIKTDKGKDVVFNIEFITNYTLNFCSYPTAIIEIDEKHPEKCKITLPNITSNTRFYVGANEIQNRIFYDFGEGTYLGKNYYIENFSNVRRKRVNTISAENVSRQGYAFLGWNTKKDYSGKFIGAGSRMTPIKKQKFLYAEYKKETDGTNFYYETIDQESIMITSYKGLVTNELVIPQSIDGKRVISISKTFNVAFNLDSLVLPSTLISLKEGAIFKGNIKNLFFYDTLNEIYDSNFPDVENVHIIANERPKFVYNDFAYFADAIDNMIVPDGKKTIYLYSGCSFTYGCYSSLLEQYLGYQYSVYNLGLIGGLTAYFQFDIITKYIMKNDILVHAPEESAHEQFLSSTLTDERIFIMCEANYDLLTIPPMDHMRDFFSSFTRYKEVKNKMKKSYDYNHINAKFNSKGDYVAYRPFNDYPEFDKQYGAVPYVPIVEYSTKESLAALEEYYKKIKEKGAMTLFSFSPMNKHAIPEMNKKDIELFDKNIKENLADKDYVKVISNLQDYIYAGRYFYDADYHLNNEGAKLRTNRLSKDIQKYLEEISIKNLE